MGAGIDDRYEWDPRKAAENLRRHGVPFEALAEFEWVFALERRDTRQAYPEVRTIALAPIRERLFTFVFTRRGMRVRAISLRKANEKEQAIYVAAR